MQSYVGHNFQLQSTTTLGGTWQNVGSAQAGTGSILIFLFVAVLGFDFLRASALCKSVNWASNVSALCLFVWRGSWIPMVALSMAMANGVGGVLGARTALRKGSGWVRAMFIVVVLALILRLAWQMVKT